MKTQTEPEPTTQQKPAQKKAYFTFGQYHAHAVNGITFDKDCVVEIEADDPRQVMYETFGQKWAFEYSNLPDMRYFPRGVIKLGGAQ